MAYTYQYPRPAVTADCVVMTREPVPQVAFDYEDIMRDAIALYKK